MVVLIYFLVSIAAGAFPAFIAKKKNRNFILWWIYGALALPVALIHTVFLLVNFEKGILFIRIFLVIYGLVIFYFITWFVSTQPVAVKYARLAEVRYEIGSNMIDNLDELTSGSVSNIIDYLKERTDIPDLEIETEMEYFEPRMITDREYVEEYAVELLQKIKGSYDMTIKSGAFEEWSVPKGESEKVFTVYIKSLKLLNIYAADSPAVLESNYRTILLVESQYFNKATIAEEYLAHLNSVKYGVESDERRYELIEQYEYIGDRYMLVGQGNLAMDCYDNTIDLYRKVVVHGEKTGKEKADIYYEIAKLYDKKKEIESAIDALKDFLTVYFESKLFEDDDNWYEFESFLKLPVIRQRKNLERALGEYMAISDRFKDTSPEMVCKLENRIMHVFFNEISRPERRKYVPVLQENYNFLVASKNIYVLPIMQEAYEFFDTYHFDEVADTYLEATEEAENNLKVVERQIIDNDSKVLLQRIEKAVDYVEKIVIGESQLNDRVLNDMNTLRKDILDASKQVNSIIIAIKDGKKVIRELLNQNEVVERSEIEIAQSDISKATKDFTDKIKVILREKAIIEKEYPELVKDINEAVEEATWITGNMAKASRNRKDQFRNMRAEVKNQVISHQTEIEEIIAVKKQIGATYSKEVSTIELETIKEEMMRLFEELNKLYKKVFPGELEEEEKAGDEGVEGEEGEEEGAVMEEEMIEEAEVE